MPNSKLVFCALAAASLLVLRAAEPRGMTIEKGLTLKLVSAPKISPDAKWVVYSISEWDKDKNRRTPHLHLVSTQGGTSVRLTNGEKGESGAVWSPTSDMIAFLADRDTNADSSKGAQAWAIRVQGGEAWQITKEDSAVSGITWSPDGKHLAFLVKDPPKDKAARDKRKKDKFDAIVVEEALEYRHLWTVEIETGKKTRLTEGSFTAGSPVYSPDGKWIAYTQSPEGTNETAYRDISRDRRTDIYVMPASGGTSRRITDQPAGDSDPVWSPDGRQLAYVSRSDAKSWAAKSDIFVVSAEGGTPRNLTANWNESASDPAWIGNHIHFAGGLGVYANQYRVPAAGGAITPVLKGNRVFTNFDSAAGKLVYTAADLLHTDDVYVSSLDGSGELRLTTANPQLGDVTLGSTEIVSWKGPGDLAVEGILIKPVGYEEGKRYPMVLLVHGGPHARWVASLGPLRNAQIYATNGYAVLLPNPRGSTGYGTQFMQANNGDWGGKDFGDLMAGVDAMIARGIADGDRLAVAGGSYGGFMTFWTITQTTRFKAAIGHAGISDWYSFHGQSDIPELMEYGFTGYPWTSTEVYRKFSPMTYVDRVRTPIMITHGEQDRRVPIAQAEQYFRALKERDVQVKFVRYPREGHGITEPNHQIDVLGRHIEWLKQHVP
ncbi:MAG: S9 family peptidase [Bryobacterales bacterium]|nr:S9 family peptidase [Bryobacterales bacterium]